MNNPAYRIAGFVLALAAVFVLAFGVGRAVDPWATDPAVPAPGTHQQHSE
ncbi:hypothetical protein [Gordonia mangrovi]|nr:hypothetical protein [Gordonia mangrovi]UVF76224.1 hypothetical protein NWF22_12485 [Gordonia mangrovi]